MSFKKLKTGIWLVGNKAMPTENTHVLLQEGIAAARSGDREIAYPLLREVTELDPANEFGWLWLAAVARSLQESEQYLKRALEINPSNARARAGLKWTLDQAAHEVPAHLEPEMKTEKGWECPLCFSNAEKAPEQCNNCGARLVLTNLEAFLTNVDVQMETVDAAIKRFESIREDDRDFDVHYGLGLAYLNAKEISRGTEHLRSASLLRPGDTTLQNQIKDLRRIHADQEDVAVKGSRQTVLIVDDSPTVRKLVTITLERQGHRVLNAVDGMDALAKLNDEVPDLILLDITMPRMDGYQVCKTIKSGEETKNVPVVMLSGKDGLVDKVKGRMAGSSDHIAKPFRPDELLQLVEQYCHAEPL